MTRIALTLAAFLLSAGAACAQFSIPDPAHTPGALNPDVTQDNIIGTICLPGWTATIRPPAHVTNAIKHQQMLAYGLPGDASDYEEDHRVPLELAGAPRLLANLWPEPWHAADGYGAGEKDQLENRVRRMVCSGEMTLADAQALFLADWRSAYDALIGGK